jgi:hypothetical protein
MAKVIIGGAPIEVALPNFKTLKAAWSHIAVVQGESDPMAGVEAILGVVSVGAVGETVSVDQLEDRLRPFLNALLIECGLATETDLGEAAPAGEAASPSTATSTPSSPNSSPPDAEAGTGI